MRTIYVKKDALFRGEPITDQNLSKAEAALRLQHAPDAIKVIYEV